MSSSRPHKAVILARGLGTRMRAASSDAELDESQARVADTGLKAMIPIGRPFLDYVLSALADAGFTSACIVIGPEHGQVREHYARSVQPRRIRIEFAEQQKPLGTADAVLAAEQFANGDAFIVLNSDNYYPLKALTALQLLGEPGLIGFEWTALVTQGNVPADRVRRFGMLDIDDRGYLLRILPAANDTGVSGRPVYASMNCWRFDPNIFDFCREVSVSPRGELELPRAVQLGIDGNRAKFRVVTLSQPVLDMSSRGDIAKVEERLRGTVVSL
ncbi:MAG TPA: nucleotidyltransferase family protein [Gemmatimonadaceae bacterium]|nr:nucleotidyltransferase family protein [Gemmatimonadaceae bacterium]